MSKLQIIHGQVIDPANNTDAIADVFIADGRIVAIGQAPDGFSAEQTIDASNQIVCPGFIDLAARLREPGQTYKATIASECWAAVTAGITQLCCPPDTQPPIDNPALAKWIQSEADQAGFAKVLALAAMTQNLQGLQPSPMASLKAAGCVGVSDAGSSIVNTALRRRFFEYAATFDLTIHLTPVEHWLAQDGYIHEGNVSTRLGLTGIPVTAETIAIARDLLLIEQTGVRAHFCRLSSAAGVELIAAAQARGLPVTADVAAHQLHLTEIDVSTFDSNAYVLPPLRSEQDRIGLIQGLLQGTINAICSDHQPHDTDAKLAPLSESEPGISGLETLLPLTLRLVQQRGVNLLQAVRWLTEGPAKILRINSGNLNINATADICIFDPNRIYQLNHIGIASRGHNTPFAQWDLQGLVNYTICDGKLVFTRLSENISLLA